jgi:hypothetical protein
LPFDPEVARHWRYFLLLQEEFARALEFVEPDPRNKDVFSLESARQLVAIGAQFETIARLFCEFKGVRLPRRANIEDLRQGLLKLRPDIGKAEAPFLPRNETLRPFANWTTKSKPAWWTAYNDLKHNPARHLDSATLLNVRDSLAALGLLTVLYAGLENTAQPRNLFLFTWARS